MATRTIVTSQPDVACEVCERRLLRGEQPDVFLAAGRRRIVCELCAPRAAHEGWLRESDHQSVALPPLRPRRGRSLFERLPAPFRLRPADRSRQVGGPSAPVGRAPDLDAVSDGELSDGHAVAGAGEEPYELLGGYEHPAGHAHDEHAGAPALEEQPAGTVFDDATLHERESPGGSDAERPSAYVEQAVDVFNASEFPRRVAGVARSLGAPEVNVRSAEHLDSVVSIVVAWELCWYRYEVDLSEPVAEALAIGQGTELGELAREDRLANAAASDSGTLVLAGI